MSNVLKKITKKYKWLRFLNYKTTKLAVLSAALFGLCLSSGHSFAKYRDENYGSGNAGAARLGDIYIDDVNSYIKTPDSFEGLSTQLHAFIFSFSITYENFEVAISYDLKLRIAPYDVTEFDYQASNYDPLHTNFYLSDSKYVSDSENYKLRTFDADGKQIDFNFTSQTTKTLEVNKYYVGISSNGTDYTWKNLDYNVNETNDKLKGVITLESEQIKPTESIVKYYKMLVFVTPQESVVGGQVTDVNFDSVKILYNFDINQIQTV